MEITFASLTESDIETLTPIMTRSFDSDAMIYTGGPGGPPGYNDGSFLRGWGLHENATSFRVDVDNVPAGAVILWLHENQEHFLGCMFLDPDYIGKGIGTRIWKMIEERYPDTLVWSTETPLRSVGNLVFYINKCGFHATEIVFPEEMPDGSVNFRKEMPHPTS